MSAPRRPFESDGKFYAGHVEHDTPRGKPVKRRVLCFGLQVATGVYVVAASQNFIRSEAYHLARRASTGQLPVGESIVDALRHRGFPVRSQNDALDDKTNDLFFGELSSRRAYHNQKQSSLKSVAQ